MTVLTEPIPRELTGLLTIGEACDRLRDEFPDISISKIRYLHGQGLINPQRSPSGYRLFTEADVGRLATLLRLQRDEGLPLRRIRTELDTPQTDRKRRGGHPLRDDGDEVDLGTLCTRAGIPPEFARRLEEYDLIRARLAAGERYYRESDVEVASACAVIARHGLDARHLRAFRTAAGRQSALLEQLVATGLHSRDPERYRAAMGELEELAAVATELAQLLLLRDLREAAHR
jgi:DNA-binding transcriptional MerR regulator